MENEVGAIGSAIGRYTKMGLDFLPRLAMALVVLLIGFWIIGMIIGGLKKLMKNRGLDESVSKFLGSLASVLLKAALLLSVLGMMGVNTTSFIAIIGAMGLAVGLALQGNLANFAAGVMVLIFKPFKVGDYVKVNGIEGFVEEISIFSSTIITPDKHTHYVPNGAITSGNITNVSKQGQVRLHIPAGIDYGADIKEARTVLLNVARQDPKVLTDPAPAVIVAELADSSVNLDLMVWCKPLDAPAVTAGMNEGVKLALDAAGIDIPYPHEVSVNK